MGQEILETIMESSETELPKERRLDGVYEIANGWISKIQRTNAIINDNLSAVRRSFEKKRSLDALRKAGN